MDVQKIITETRSIVIDTFTDIDTWFDKENILIIYRPNDGGWTIGEILEHIGLTNHFLLILIDKGTTKALYNIHELDIQNELKNFVFQYDKLLDIGRHKSFSWIRPEHMEPIGNKSLNEVRIQIQEQMHHCLSNLDKLRNGEGVLYKTTMSVNDLGKINVYEYIYFLAQHGKRHVVQMQKNEVEFRKSLFRK